MLWQMLNVEVKAHAKAKANFNAKANSITKADLTLMLRRTQKLRQILR